MRKILTFLLFLAPMLLAAKSQRPNILFMFTDDHSPLAISAYGSKINKTPHMDRIAREGMRFDNCLVTNSICGPSRAVILTGKYSHINGFLTNGNRFDGEQQNFAKILQKVGYQTAVIGKWHLKTQPTGFHYSEVLIGQGPYYNPPMLKNGERTQHTGYTTEIVTDLALDWLREGREKDKPFLLMYQHKAPHRNWQPGPKHLNMYDDVTIPEPDSLFDDYEGRGTAARTQRMEIKRDLSANDLKLNPPRNLTPEQLKRWNAAYGPKNEAFKKANLQGDDLIRWKYQRYIKDYLRCVASVDDNIGRVLDYLDEHGLADNTLVIYSSDQGWFLGENGWFDKRWFYEYSLRMPLLARWPGVIQPGSTNADMVSNVDFAPTFLDVAGAADKIPADFQGRSFLPQFKGGTPEDWRKSFYYHYYEFPGAHSVRRHFGVRTETHKLIRFYGIDEWELYDLKADPTERTSRYGDPKYAEITAKLKKELTRLQTELKVPEDTRPIQRRKSAPKKKKG
jgi:arylsulfatase A-like enzyme